MLDDVKQRAAKTWFGYGRWEAPFWFLGMEPGGTDDHASYEAWEHLGGGELIDCRAHHINPDFPGWARWHSGERPPTQPTWRRLIQLLLAYKGLPTDLDSVRLYQRDQWGSKDGETALLEVSALHSPSLAISVDRESNRAHRIAILHARISEYAPAFVVCYGLGYREIYSQVVGAPFDSDGIARSGKTVCALVEHPTARPGKPASWWENVGRQLRLATATN
jgi:hypothetical protein